MKTEKEIKEALRLYFTRLIHYQYVIYNASSYENPDKEQKVTQAFKEAEDYEVKKFIEFLTK